MNCYGELSAAMKSGVECPVCRAKVEDTKMGGNVTDIRMTEVLAIPADDYVIDMANTAPLMPGESPNHLLIGISTATPPEREPIPRNVMTIPGMSNGVADPLMQRGFTTHTFIRARRAMGAGPFERWYCKLFAANPAFAQRAYASFAPWYVASEKDIASAGARSVAFPAPDTHSGWLVDVPGIGAKYDPSTIHTDLVLTGRDSKVRSPAGVEGYVRLKEKAPKLTNESVNLRGHKYDLKKITQFFAYDRTAKIPAPKKRDSGNAAAASSSTTTTSSPTTTRLMAEMIEITPGPAPAPVPVSTTAPVPWPASWEEYGQVRSQMDRPETRDDAQLNSPSKKVIRKVGFLYEADPVKFRQGAVDFNPYHY
jgi:hypothetical protein